MRNFSLILLVGILVLLASNFSSIRYSMFNLLSPSNYELFLDGDEKDVITYLKSKNGKMGLDSFYALIRNNRVDLLRRILREFDVDPNMGADTLSLTPLMFASEMLNLDAVLVLLNFGADVNYVDRYGNTPLIKALLSSEGNSQNQTKNQFKVASLLIEAGANTEVVSDIGWTPLKAAIRNQNLELVHILVNNSADVFRLAKNGSNYLFDCQSSQCYEYLISLGLDVNQPNYMGKTVLHSAVYIPSDNTEKVKALINLGADICLVDNQGNNILWFAELGDLNNVSDKQDFFQKKMAQNRNTKVYQYIKQLYLSICSRSG